VPLIPDETRNFVNALSAFWPAYFRDYDEQTAFYAGVQINMGQLYLELLQAVLGTSLKDMPLFSREYFKLLTVRRDRLYYVEGPSPTDDRYEADIPDETFMAIEGISNRVLEPTAVLAPRRDFDLVAGRVRFVRNLFDSNGSGAFEPLFAIKYIGVVEPAQYADPLDLDFSAAGARIGDFLYTRIGAGVPTQQRIANVDGRKLLLASASSDFNQRFDRRSFVAAVVRTPFDAQKQGVAMPAHPRLVVRFSAQATDATLVGGTPTIDFSAETYYKGFWAAGVLYTEGDLVNVFFGALYRAKATHISPGTFSLNEWDALAGNYVHVHSPDAVQNDGLYAGRISGSAGILQLVRSVNFVSAGSNRVVLTFVVYEGTYQANAQPQLLLPQNFITPGTLSFAARRGHARYLPMMGGGVEIFPAGEQVLEGVDYAVNYENGEITMLSGWLPSMPARTNYEWQRLVAQATYSFRGNWVPFTTYNPGEIVVSGGVTYVCDVAAPSVGVFPGAPYFIAWREPFTLDVQVTVPVMSLWGANVLLDEQALYNNFGYLLDYQKPSSEQYRAFLRGVSQLFLLGPTLERFESALNTMANLPVVRDDDEVLRAYDDGYVGGGADGELIDSDAGRDGVFDATTSRFSAATAKFYASDVGALLRVAQGARFITYTVVSVLSPSLVVVFPSPPVNEVNVVWSFRHVSLINRFRVTSGSYLFSAADLNGSIVLEGSSEARNVGQFSIIGIEDPTTVVLESPYGFLDQTGLTWKISRTSEQVVTTSRAQYRFPLLVKMRQDVGDVTSLNVLTFKAFEALTEAFRVVDYISDPTWWHNVAIPENILGLALDTPGRRQVTPELVEHVFGALDTPAFGDFGLAYGVDDESIPGIARAGQATWYGVDSVQLQFAAGVPVARLGDVGKYLTINTPGFRGWFQIKAMTPDGLALTLDRFPPPEAAGVVPPVVLDVTLAPLLYRRTIAFILMDRFLKYHALQMRIDKNTPLPPEFIADVTRLITEARPSHTYIYLDSLTSFVDKLQVEDEMALDIGPTFVELFHLVDNTLRFNPESPVRFADAYRYTQTSTGVSGTPGTYTLPVVLPAGDVEYSLVKAQFDVAVTVAGPRRPAEGVDYTVNYVTGEVTIPAGSLMPVGPNILHYVYCIRRIRLGADPLEPTETRAIYGGVDPTIYKSPGQPAGSCGFVDLGVQITFGS